MVDRAKDFLHSLASMDLSHRERAIALIWFYGLEDLAVSVNPSRLAKEIEGAGYSSVNITRLKRELTEDRRTAKGKGNGFKIRIDVRRELDKKYSPFIQERVVQRSNAVLPLDLFDGTRGYLEKVARQINASYDYGLYDCCAVMCRRLLETLIIELYEFRGWADEIKGPDGHFLMYSGLLAKLENDRRVNLGRNSKFGLQKFKELGDKSAHDRRFNARKHDIDKIESGLRSAAEDLLHLGGLVATRS